MEELCQNLLISGPDLVLRRKANDSTKKETESDSNNFDVNRNSSFNQLFKISITLLLRFNIFKGS